MSQPRPELLAPAGDLQKLQSALDFGADAVYLGGERFGLRAQAGYFGLPLLRQAIDLCHARGRQLYLTLNAYLRPEQQDQLEAYLEELRPLAVDAYIVADPGVLATVRRIDPQRPLHLSTQANTTSAAAAEFWRRQGVSRVNLARELSLAEIAKVRSGTELELEVFVHGAMCVAYSGRCLLSATMTGRSANQGNCAHPCRWNYAVVEESRPGEAFPVAQDAFGTYLFNSRDLCLVEDLPALLAAGVNSLKVEGRMKSRYYVAAVTRVYRAALDAWLADPAGFVCDPLWLAELDKVSHRPYDRGFLHGHDDPRIHTEDSRYQRSHDFVGVVLEPAGERFLVEGRNRFFPEEELELIGPRMRQASFRVGAVAAEDGRALQVVQPNARVLMELPAGTSPGDLLRRAPQ